MDQKREHFLAIAKKHFCRTDFREFDFTAAAMDSGMTVAEIDELFPDKLEIFFTVVQRELFRVAEHAAETLPAAGLDAQVRHLLRLRFDFFAEYIGCIRPVIGEIMVSREGWREEYDTMMWRFSVSLAALIQAAMRRGEIRGDADERNAVRALVSYYVAGILMISRGEVKDGSSTCEFIFPLVTNLVNSLR